jgi:hypothetical protein
MPSLLDNSLFNIKFGMVLLEDLTHLEMFLLAFLDAFLVSYLLEVLLTTLRLLLKLKWLENLSSMLLIEFLKLP